MADRDSRRSRVLTTSAMQTITSPSLRSNQIQYLQCVSPSISSSIGRVTNSLAQSMTGRNLQVDMIGGLSAGGCSFMPSGHHVIMPTGCHERSSICSTS